jgi:DNA-binding transcriptional MocR family regulator
MNRYQIRGRTSAAIATSIEEAVHAGIYLSEQHLPTIRELAATLRVSPVTVASAYRRLHERGLLVAAGRRGTRVRAGVAGTSARVEAVRAPAGVVDLATGNPDPVLLPPLEPIVRSMPLPATRYGESPVNRSLAAFAADEFSSDGIPADSLAVMGGGLDAIERLLREHLRPGDRVGIEDPTLPAVVHLIGASGFVAEPIALDADGPQPASFEEALGRVRALLITTRAQNPTGAAVSPARAAVLRRLLRGRDEVLVVENDPAGPVSGVPAITVAAGSHPRWAVIRPVSKFLGPDLRVALVAGDPLTVARIQGRQALGVRWVSHLLQQIAFAAWSDPASGRRLARASDLYAQRRSAVIEALAAQGVTAVARSGFNVWIPVAGEHAAVQALVRRGWAVAAGEPFRIRSGPGVRVTTSALAVESAKSFAAACAEAVRPSAVASA